MIAKADGEVELKGLILPESARDVPVDDEALAGDGAAASGIGGIDIVAGEGGFGDILAADGKLVAAS